MEWRETTWPLGFTPLSSNLGRANKRLIATVAISKFRSSLSKHRTLQIPNSNKNADPARLVVGVRRGGIGVLRDQRESRLSRSGSFSGPKELSSNLAPIAHAFLIGPKVAFFGPKSTTATPTEGRG
jgi:hypothetical protein